MVTMIMKESSLLYNIECQYSMHNNVPYFFFFRVYREICFSKFTINTSCARFNVSMGIDYCLKSLGRCFIFKFMQSRKKVYYEYCEIFIITVRFNRIKSA